ncbi:MAG: hypothetical protein ACD_2C00016G0001 [uncultured bacterium (gcode 4)]|uniref:Uncharacterized protein n=1 Tax=uncultured bacterium (gcode 4) TaxID=1234023 RepID=K2H327_9BACT|nr:MAG: hypothetical protein ACD_2C00016G0001 [uncultured bacterium (gcode 4)]
MATDEKDVIENDERNGKRHFRVLIWLLSFLAIMAFASCTRDNAPVQAPQDNTWTNQEDTETRQNDLSFFVTSESIWNGWDLWGLKWADMQCSKLAESVNASSRTWRAYLSTQGTGAENARDRIWNWPWVNAKWVVIANNVAELHSDTSNLNKQTALTEKGEIVNWRGDTPNMHDILTGSQPDWTAFAISEDRTCSNWTSSSSGSAMVWHSDRIGTNESAEAKSWNSSHLSRWPDGGCSQNDLKSTWGNWLLYCFSAE